MSGKQGGWKSVTLSFKSKLMKIRAPSSKRVSGSRTKIEDPFHASYPQARSFTDRRYQRKYVPCNPLDYRCPPTNPSLQTLVSSSTYNYHQNPHAFKDPDPSRPERRLSDPTSNARETENKSIPFSKGSINVAYAELHLALAHLVRRSEIVNNGTSGADTHRDDCIAPMKQGHLKVMARESVGR